MLACKSQFMGNPGGNVDTDRYAHLDREREKMQERRAANPSLSFEDSLKARMDSDGSEDKLGWIHGNDIEKMWRVYLEEENANEWLR
jgi:hypothetical protein